MSAIVGSARIIPSRVINLQLRRLEWRLRCLGKNRNQLLAQLEAICHDLDELGDCSSLEKDKFDERVRLSHEKAEIDRKLKPFNERYSDLCCSVAHCRAVKTPNK